MTIIKEVTLIRYFSAPKELVFKAFTNREMLMQWWGPHGFTNPECEMDARENGKWKINMHAPQLGFPNSWVEGVFTEIIPGEKLVFTTKGIFRPDGSHGLEGLNTVIFQEENGKTKLTLHAALTKLDKGFEMAANGMEQGWSESFEKLATLLTK
ncbi:MAG: SRPBCC domain-containing protein [Bacteroidetes bacterium]|nr:SRPBCC domain-containing protein [Bacteroidota bacterium]